MATTIADAAGPWPPRFWASDAQSRPDPDDSGQLILAAADARHGTLAIEAHRPGQRFYCALPIEGAVEERILQRLRASVGLSLLEIGPLEV